MELLSSMIPTSHRANTKFSTLGNVYGFLTWKIVQLCKQVAIETVVEKKKKKTQQFSAKKLQCIFNSRKCYSIIFYMWKNH